VNKHHGSIEVNSEEGKGTTFIIAMPVEDNEISQVE
jgi:signal transduction histidine kinase